eukprot:TRINITY_DN9092_c0_g1_i1.p1 TRINITY_DN9092_c0_g1~~TRINITY_DN9092_c0_g1_i1.p1  ORF type:complete len:503 (+),score=50.74 TRINITY_DN9092_c0_g1_i1:68-1510(+)
MCIRDSINAEYMGTHSLLNQPMKQLLRFIDYSTQVTHQELHEDAISQEKFHQRDLISSCRMILFPKPKHNAKKDGERKRNQQHRSKDINKYMNMFGLAIDKPKSIKASLQDRPKQRERKNLESILAEINTPIEMERERNKNLQKALDKQDLNTKDDTVRKLNFEDKSIEDEKHLEITSSYIEHPKNLGFGQYFDIKRLEIQQYLLTDVAKISVEELFEIDELKKIFGINLTPTRGSIYSSKRKDAIGHSDNGRENKMETVHDSAEFVSRGAYKQKHNSDNALMFTKPQTNEVKINVNLNHRNGGLHCKLGDQYCYDGSDTTMDALTTNDRNFRNHVVNNNQYSRLPNEMIQSPFGRSFHIGHLKPIDKLIDSSIPFDPTPAWNRKASYLTTDRLKLEEHHHGFCDGHESGRGESSYWGGPSMHGYAGANYQQRLNHRLPMPEYQESTYKIPADTDFFWEERETESTKESRSIKNQRGYFR